MNNNNINDSSVDIENLFQPNTSSIVVSEIISSVDIDRDVVDHISGSADEISGNF